MPSRVAHRELPESRANPSLGAGASRCRRRRLLWPGSEPLLASCELCLREDNSGISSKRDSMVFGAELSSRTPDRMAPSTGQALETLLRPVRDPDAVRLRGSPVQDLECRQSGLSPSLCTAAHALLCPCIDTAAQLLTLRP